MEIDDWFAIGTLIVITITWFILFMIFLKKPIPIKDVQVAASPVPVPVPVAFSPISPVFANKTFGPVKTIDGNGSQFYYMVTNGSGYITFRGNRDMEQWGIDKPLSYTHAKINNIIFKFNNPNSSDSSGFAVDSQGNAFPSDKIPASQYSNIIQFGFFI